MAEQKSSIVGDVLDFGQKSYWKAQENDLARRQNRQDENQRRFDRLMSLLSAYNQQGQMDVGNNRMDAIRNWSM